MRKRRSSRRRPRGRKIYGIAYLLDKQPKALKRHENWTIMTGYLKSDPRLFSLRFNRRCYSLLHNGIIRAEHLENFYRTYNLPRNPFFPLFLLIKRDYLEKREKKKKERENYIREGLHRLPEYVRTVFILSARMEKELNGGKICSVYKKRFLPSSRKAMDRYLHFSHGDWIRFFDAYLDFLGEAYERLPLKKLEYLGAAMALRWEPEPPYALPDSDTVNRLFRSLSKELHPDRGGDAALFIKIKWAKDYFRNCTLS